MAPPINVGLLGVKARISDHGHCLGCERFVQFDEVDVVEGQASLFQHRREWRERVRIPSPRGQCR